MGLGQFVLRSPRWPGNADSNREKNLETLERESFVFKEWPVIKPLAKPYSFDYPCAWEWLGPGGSPGLQNLWRVALRAAVGSTPIHSRLLLRR